MDRLPRRRFRFHGWCPVVLGSTTTGQGPDPAAGGDQPNRITPADTLRSGEWIANHTPPTSAFTETTTPAATRHDLGAGTTAAAGLTTTVDGAAEMTRYGAVQVEVQITDGTITDVVALQYPQRERRDLEINQVAIPELHDQVIAAQSGQGRRRVGSHVHHRRVPHLTAIGTGRSRFRFMTDIAGPHRDDHGPALVDPGPRRWWTRPTSTRRLDRVGEPRALRPDLQSVSARQ